MAPELQHISVYAFILTHTSQKQYQLFYINTHMLYLATVAHKVDDTRLAIFINTEIQLNEPFIVTGFAV